MTGSAQPKNRTGIRVDEIYEKTSSAGITAKNDLTVEGDIAVTGTVDGVDIATLNSTVGNFAKKYYVGATTGSSNAYVITTGLSLSAYAEGQEFTITPNFTNTGAATANVDSIGSKTIKIRGGSALTGGELQSGVQTRLLYNGTDLIILDVPQKTNGSWSPTITGSGGTISSASIEYADYLQVGKLVFVALRVMFTANSSNIAIEFNAPTEIAIDNQWIGSHGRNASSGSTSGAPLYARTETTGDKIIVSTADGIGFSAGTGRYANVFGFYFAA